MTNLQNPIHERKQLAKRFAQSTDQEKVYPRNFTKLFQKYAPFDLYEGIRFCRGYFPSVNLHSEKHSEVLFSIDLLQDAFLTIHARLADWQVRESQTLDKALDHVVSNQPTINYVKDLEIFAHEFVKGQEVEMHLKEYELFYSLKETFLNIHAETHQLNWSVYGVGVKASEV